MVHFGGNKASVLAGSFISGVGTQNSLLCVGGFSTILGPILGPSHFVLRVCV